MIFELGLQNMNFFFNKNKLTSEVWTLYLEN